jgi:cytoskeletal protein CcmA (bactofilin family)
MIGSKSKEENSATGLHNALAAGTFIKGDISTEIDFRLDGSVDGNVDCKGKIVIGAKGSVNGYIHADSAEISGSVKGNLTIIGTLVLRATATIDGDIETGSLEVEPNASFNGECRMVAQPLK